MITPHVILIFLKYVVAMILIDPVHLFCVSFVMEFFGIAPTKYQFITNFSHSDFVLRRHAYKLKLKENRRD